MTTLESEPAKRPRGRRETRTIYVRLDPAASAYQISKKEALAEHEEMRSVDEPGRASADDAHKSRSR